MGWGSDPAREISFVSLMAYGPKVFHSALAMGGLQLLKQGRALPNKCMLSLLSRGPHIILETTFPSMSPTHIKAECKRVEPGTAGQDGVQGTGPRRGNVAQLPL